MKTKRQPNNTNVKGQVQIMTLYTFQPQELIDHINSDGAVLTEMVKTNLYKHRPENGVPIYMEAYQWMGRKLSEKTGLWLKDIYGEDLDAPTDSDGDYIDEHGQKLPVLPFWCWYITDGKNQEPDRSYSFDRRTESDEYSWNADCGRTLLVTLEVPEDKVLLSDANAWYCALETRPCYEFEPNEKELMEAYESKMSHLKTIFTDPDSLEEAQVLAEELWDEMIRSWDNILRLEGRRLRTVQINDITIKEKYDIQAVIPFILKDWVVDVEAL